MECWGLGTRFLDRITVGLDFHSDGNSLVLIVYVCVRKGPLVQLFSFPWIDSIVVVTIFIHGREKKHAVMCIHNTKSLLQPQKAGSNGRHRVGRLSFVLCFDKFFFRKS